MNEDMKLGYLTAMQGVYEEIDTILCELHNKGIDEPKGFSVLIGFVKNSMEGIQL